MLKHIPFYIPLFGKELKNVIDKDRQVYATQSHVLAYGAVAAHNKGEKGCIASNKTIGKEIGVSQDTAKNILSQLNKAGWVKVTLINRKRMTITPTSLNKLEALPDKTDASHKRDTSEVSEGHSDGIHVSREQDIGHHAGGNIEDSTENTGNFGTKAPKEVPVFIMPIDDVSSPRKHHYGDAPVDDILNYFEQTTGLYITTKIQANRNAATNLIRQRGLENVKSVIDYVQHSNTEKYAKQIHNLIDLAEYWNNLQVFALREKTQNERPRVVVI